MQLFSQAGGFNEVLPQWLSYFQWVCLHTSTSWRGELLDLLQDLTKGTAGAQPTSPSSGVPSDEQALRERGSQVRWLKDVDRNLKKITQKTHNWTCGEDEHPANSSAIFGWADGRTLVAPGFWLVLSHTIPIRSRSNPNFHYLQRGWPLRPMKYPHSTISQHQATITNIMFIIF